ncbi:MAG: hypothetical protein IKG88_01530 [Bacteroidales bacterium]|nr:hypothetical protein [Bacteroidales bacterium]
MKNSKVIVAALAACMVLFAGCKKESNGVVNLGTKLEPIGANSKIYLNPNDVPQFFTDGEQIRVNNDDNPYTITSSYTVTGVQAVEEGGTYYAMYPASIVTDDNGVQASTAIKLPHLQTWQTETVGGVVKQKINLPCAAALAASGDGVLRFRNLCSLIEVQWTNNTGSAQTIRSIEVTAQGRGLWGTGTATINGNQSAINIPYTGSNSRVVLEMPNGIEVAAHATSPKMYVIVPPYTSGTPFTVKIRFNTGSDNVEVNYPSINIDRNTVYFISNSGTPQEDTEISGYYSISDHCKVVFSKGNLQHIGALSTYDDNSTWHFADNQYDFFGIHNLDETGSSRLTGTVDLFCWSISNEVMSGSWDANAGYLHGGSTYGLRTPEEEDDYFSTTPEFLDWGTMAIDDDPANTWFTMTKTEWEYLLNGRDNADALRINVDITDIPNHPTGLESIHGCLLFPDDWTADRIPSGITLTYHAVNQLSYTDFRRLEAVGCVLLPEAGYREVGGFNNNWVSSAMTYHEGHYWTSTVVGSDPYEANIMKYVYHANQYAANNSTSDDVTFWGNSVRLVKPAPGYTYANCNRTGPSSK